VDMSGSFVYVTNQGDNTVSAFSINPASGALTPVAGSPFNTGTAPVSVVTTGIVQ
jgi:6-phosphogluconolactonase (cycloisomerase 2 family)